MKNKNLFASILTVTSGLAAPMAYTAPALARSVRAEAHKPQSFVLKSLTPARHTDENGIVRLGHIFMSLEQEQITPGQSNRLKSEMIGTLYFSDGSNWVGIANQEEDQILLDLVHKDAARGSVYQVYGCSTSMNSCIAEHIEMNFRADHGMELNFRIPENRGIEILTTSHTGEKVWSSKGSTVMEEVQKIP